MLEYTPALKRARFERACSAIAADLPDLLAGVAIGAFVSTKSLASPVFIIGTAALIVRLGLIHRARMPTLAVVAVCLILYSSIITAAITIPSGPGVIIALWTGLMALLFFWPPTATSLKYVVPFWVLHAVATLIDCSGKVLSDFYWPAQGIADSRSVAAGFLALGIVYSIHQRQWWLLSLLTMAVLTTGGRLPTGVVLLITGALVVTRLAPLKTLVVMAISGAVIVLATGDYVPAMYRVILPEGFELTVTEKVQGDLTGRLAMPESPSIIPKGPMGATEDAHNVFLRMSIEQGIVAALAWLGLSLAALWRKPRFDMTWWMLVAFLMLTTLDYYPMYPLVIAALWWALVGMRLQSATSTEQFL